MTTRTQGVVVALLAAVLIRLTWTGEYLRFVLPWMRWPLLATGLILLLLAIRPVLGRDGGESVPRTTWLLLAPTLIVFAVAPPPLGAFLAERREAQLPPRFAAPSAIPAATASGPLDLGLDEFTWGAAQASDPMGLAGRVVQMDGFVSADPDGGWYLTRLEIYCCAADAVVERVKVIGQPAPPRNQWVRTTGSWVTGTGADLKTAAQIRATDVTRIPTPEDTYG